LRCLVALLAILSPLACELDIPDLGEPFVSDQIMGRWTGDWGVGTLFQEGSAVMECRKDEDEGVVFQLWMAGGAMSSGSEAPHEIRLTGPDNTETLVLKGYSDKFGDVGLVLSADGTITGIAEPDSAPSVEIGGYVTSDTVYLGIILSLFEGEAILAYEGPIEEDEQEASEP
jgi:hypothetical protein